ncbi:MAG TPA: MarR family transcriptional regulator [Bauldia sp.]|nr:MarR family transcriptional regulator [Bauldia sp.]
MIMDYNVHRMTQEQSQSQPWYETIVIPALLRHARNTYGGAMRKALAAAGYDDIPRNGLYVIGGLALGAGDAPLSVLIKELRVSKQSAGQLVDTLVLRGYLQRVPDTDDRRRQRVVLTERGKAAADVQAAARAKIDAALAARVGEDGVKRIRRALAVIVDLGRDEAGDDEG